MCGLVGALVDLAVHPALAAETLLRMRDRAAERGPDAGGLHLEGPLALAHRRLAEPADELEAEPRQEEREAEGRLDAVVDVLAHRLEPARGPPEVAPDEGARVFEQRRVRDQERAHDAGDHPEGGPVGSPEEGRPRGRARPLKRAQRHAGKVGAADARSKRPLDSRAPASQVGPDGPLREPSVNPNDHERPPRRSGSLPRQGGERRGVPLASSGVATTLEREGRATPPQDPWTLQRLRSVALPPTAA